MSENTSVYNYKYVIRTSDRKVPHVGHDTESAARDQLEKMNARAALLGTSTRYEIVVRHSPDTEHVPL